MTNYTIVTSQHEMNHYVIWIAGWQQGCKHVSQTVYFEWVWKKTRFCTEARVNLKIAYCQVVLLTLGIVFKFIVSHLLILIWRFIAGMLWNQILNGDNETPMTSNRYMSGTCVLKPLPSRQSGQSMNGKSKSRIDQNLQLMVTCPILYSTSLNHRIPVDVFAFVLLH